MQLMKREQKSAFVNMNYTHMADFAKTILLIKSLKLNVFVRVRERESSRCPTL